MLICYTCISWKIYYLWSPKTSFLSECPAGSECHHQSGVVGLFLWSLPAFCKGRAVWEPALWRLASQGMCITHTLLAIGEVQRGQATCPESHSKKWSHQTSPVLISVSRRVRRDTGCGGPSAERERQWNFPQQSWGVPRKSESAVRQPSPSGSERQSDDRGSV